MWTRLSQAHAANPSDGHSVLVCTLLLCFTCMEFRLNYSVLLRCATLPFASVALHILCPLSKRLFLALTTWNPSYHPWRLEQTISSD